MDNLIMKLGSKQKNLDSPPGQTVDGSFRRSKYGMSPDRRSEISTSSRFFPTSRRVFKGLKDARKLLDIDSFAHYLEDWVADKICVSATNRKQLFKPPFTFDELRKLDYALEGVLFQQLFRMPYSVYASDDLREDEFLALEDFLHAIIEGLWNTFWNKSGSLPCFVSCPRHPGSKFYPVENAISKGRLESLSGAALIMRNAAVDTQARWDHVMELVLFKSDISGGNELGFSAAVVCEALFYGFHILLSRSLSKYNADIGDSVYLLVLDSKFGGVVKFGGDLSKLEINSNDPYRSVAEWIRQHSEINVSPVDRIWNKLGNANWGDLGTLHLILATFYSIVQWIGPPQMSIASLAADHSLRLQKRIVECRLTGNGSSRSMYMSQSGQNEREIVELGPDDDQKSSRQSSHLNLKPGEVMMLETTDGQKIGFHIRETLIDGNCLSYSGISLENPNEVLTVYVGAHPSRLEPSWEDMSLWYQVQRQTKVLNTMKQHGVSCKYLPHIIASGRMLHSGPCNKKSSGDRCDHPWCGTPILVTFPVGKPLSSIVSHEGLLSAEEAIRCCRDCLSALRSASLANVQHGDICPENIIRVEHSGSTTRSLYMPVSWGRAVLEEKDSPAINLQFSSTYALQQGRLCPVSDAESLIYLLYFVSGGSMQQQDSIESALQWRERCWALRLIQQHLGEVSPLLKAFADYVDSLCGTPYPVDYDIWLKRLNMVVDGSDRGKMVQEMVISVRLDHVSESPGTSGGRASVSYET